MTATPTRDAQTAFARAIVDEWGRAGIVLAALAPGSRSTPLALALAEAPFPLHVFLDERSAAFFALGAAKASGRPAAVLCTSGTAAANFHPAVLEAHHGRVPLLVCTADRPPELRDVGAGQTIDQVGLYGNAVRWFADVPVPEDRSGAGAEWRALAARAAIASTGPPAGPVHLNVAFREPLVPTGAPASDAPGRPDGTPWVVSTTPRRSADDAVVARVADMVASEPRGLLVAGDGAGVCVDTAERFAAASGWPVLADPLSGLRTEGTVGSYDALLRFSAFASSHVPGLVVRVGAPPTGRVGREWLDAAPRLVLVDPDAVWLDPGRVATHRVAADPDTLLASVAAVLERDGHAREGEARRCWTRSWRGRGDYRAHAAIDAVLDASREPSEARIARDVVRALPHGATLVVASSMPVRDVEACAPPRSGVRFIANRGVSGIDGFVSTALGVASVSSGPVVALLGDLCFLHDTNALLGAVSRGVDITFVVVDNDGGGIFSFLPQAEDPTHFEQLFGTPHGVDLVALAGVHSVAAREVADAHALPALVLEAVAAGGVRLLVVRTDRAANVVRHRDLAAAVADALA